MAGARGKVFVVGGFNDGDAVAVHAFDIAGGSWTPLARLPAPFKMPNVASVGAPGAERLLVLGGLENNQTVEYDFATDTWKALAPAPVERGRGVAAVAVKGDKVLLAGGVLRGQSANALNTGKRVSEFLAYDTQTDKWEQLMSMPIATGYAMGAVLGEEFWVMGGSTDFVRTDQVLVYDFGREHVDHPAAAAPQPEQRRRRRPARQGVPHRRHRHVHRDDQPRLHGAGPDELAMVDGGARHHRPLRHGRRGDRGQDVRAHGAGGRGDRPQRLRGVAGPGGVHSLTA